MSPSGTNLDEGEISSLAPPAFVDISDAEEQDIKALFEMECDPDLAEILKDRPLLETAGDS